MTGRQIKPLNGVGDGPCAGNFRFDNRKLFPEANLPYLSGNTIPFFIVLRGLKKQFSEIRGERRFLFVLKSLFCFIFMHFSLVL